MTLKHDPELPYVAVATDIHPNLPGGTVFARFRTEDDAENYVEEFMHHHWVELVDTAPLALPCSPGSVITIDGSMPLVLVGVRWVMLMAQLERGDSPGVAQLAKPLPGVGAFLNDDQVRTLIAKAVKSGKGYAIHAADA